MSVKPLMHCYSIFWAMIASFLKQVPFLNLVVYRNLLLDPHVPGVQRGLIMLRRRKAEESK